MNEFHKLKDKQFIVQQMLESDEQELKAGQGYSHAHINN